MNNFVEKSFEKFLEKDYPSVLLFFGVLLFFPILFVSKLFYYFSYPFTKIFKKALKINLTVTWPFHLFAQIPLLAGYFLGIYPWLIFSLLIVLNLGLLLYLFLRFLFVKYLYRKLIGGFWVYDGISWEKYNKDVVYHSYKQIKKAEIYYQLWGSSSWSLINRKRCTIDFRACQNFGTISGRSHSINEVKYQFYTNCILPYNKDYNHFYSDLYQLFKDHIDDFRNINYDYLDIALRKTEKEQERFLESHREFLEYNNNEPQKEDIEIVEQTKDQHPALYAGKYSDEYCGRIYWLDVDDE